MMKRYIPKGIGYFIAENHAFRRAEEDIYILFQEEHEGRAYGKLADNTQVYVHAGKLKEVDNE